MSNERIDLTQFEKRENGEYKVEASIGDYTRYMYEDETDIALSKQLNMLPDLITELKRMYEREDELVEILSILEDRHGVDMSQFFERDASE